jgi:predicted RNA methylase
LFEKIHLEYDGVDEKVLGDFCCGTGMYSIAACYFDV